MTLPGLLAGRGGILNAGSTLREIMNAIGLTSGVQLLLDAGDSASYDGSSQTWTDLSGNGRDFVRGATSASQSSDPTFAGHSGASTTSEYFSFDGGDYFTKATANDAFFNSLHKNSAAFTLVMLGYANNITSATNCLFGAGDGFVGGSPGVVISNTGSNGRNMFVQIVKEGPVDQLNKVMTAEATNNSWNLFGVSLDEATGSLILSMNGTQESSSGNVFASPSTLDAGTVWQFAATGGATNIESTGNRSAAITMLNRALSSSELTNLYGAIKAKFPLP